LHISTSFLL